MRRILAALSLVLCPLGASAQPISLSVTNVNDAGPGSLRQAVIDANNLNISGQTIAINFNPGLNIALASFLPPLNPGRAGALSSSSSPNTNTLVLNGNGSTVNGSVSATTGFQVFFAYAGTVQMNNLTIANGLGRGGNGYSGGGGGAGLGGGLFVNNFASATLSSVTFNNTQARGGGSGATGGAYGGGGGLGGNAGTGFGAGGGGLYGDGGNTSSNGGGGGGGGVGAVGGFGSSTNTAGNGAAGIFTGGAVAADGVGTPSALGGANGGGGGGAGAPSSFGDYGGGGGVGATSIAGGWGGGGGGSSSNRGGAGGEFGGGGGSTSNSDGAAGGWGGGGGAGSSFSGGTHFGGFGGWGGGGGGAVALAGGSSVGGPGGFGAGGGDTFGRGGGGLGAGGAVFVRLGGSLTLNDPTFSGTLTATGGIGNASSGMGLGQGLFLGGTTTLNISTGRTMTLGTDFLGGSAVNNSNDADGRGLLVKAGGGTLILNGANSVHGGSRVDAGRLVIANPGALGALGASSAVVDMNTVSPGATLEVATGTTLDASVTVQGGGTFAVNGTYRPESFNVANNGVLAGRGAVGTYTATIGGGGRVAPGDGDRATLSFGVGGGGLSLFNGSALDLELGPTSDQVRVSGGNFFVENSPGAVTLNVINAGLTPGQPYTLLDWTGATPFNAAVSNFQLAPTSVPGLLSVSGSTLQFTPVPEPAGLTGLGLAAVLASEWFRRRRG